MDGVKVERRQAQDAEPAAMQRRAEAAGFVDGRAQAAQLAAQQERADASARVAQLREIAGLAGEGRRNETGLPDGLKAGIEALSGMDMSAVRVHRNSDKPAQLDAHAYAQGAEIHLAPGQERHLPHEAWHVVQQAQGRVSPTLEGADGTEINDDLQLEAEADVMGTQADARGAALAGRATAPQSLSASSASAAKTHSTVQRLINKVTANGDGILGITRDQKRPSGNLRGETGDHLTAYVTFDHQVMTAVEGKDLRTAWDNLLKVYAAIQAMPGYVDSARAMKVQFDALGERLNEVDPDEVGLDHIRDFGNAIIEVRNNLKYTAYRTKGSSTGGNNEAIAGGLYAEERNIRKTAKCKYSKDAILITMWQLFDHARFSMSLKGDEGERALQQHRMSMLDTYWRICDAYGIDDDDLQDYYDNHHRTADAEASDEEMS